MVTAAALLDDLHAARGGLTADSQDSFRSYFIGALSGAIADIPGGAEAWASALKTAHDCLGRESCGISGVSTFTSTTQPTRSSL